MAAPHRPSGWIGECHPGQPIPNTTHTWGGWCDGNGPESYHAVVQCSQGVLNFYYKYGPTRWFGDRNGSYASCDTGDRVYAGALGIV